MGEDMIPYFKKLMPMILEAIQDHSSPQKREVSLRTLNRLVSSAGVMVRPYIMYPTLLPRILSVLRDGINQPWSLRKEVLRTVGVLGALDPYRHDALSTLSASDSARRLNMTEVHQSALSGIGETQGPWVVPGTTRGPSCSGQAVRSTLVPNKGTTYLEPLAPGLAPANEVPDIHSWAGGVEPLMKVVSCPCLVCARTIVSRLALRIQALVDEGDAPAHTCMFEQSSMVAQPSTGTVVQQMSRLTPASEDYHPKVCHLTAST